MNHSMKTGLDGFDEFWQRYPKRQSKKDAKKAWEQVKAAAHLDEILTALAWQCQQPDWLKDSGQFVPLPSSYLRAERWDDEPMEQPTGKAQTVRNLAVVQKWAQR
jgi:hypothetical protein